MLLAPHAEGHEDDQTQAGRVPKAIEDIAGQLFQSKASVVMTNVASATEPLHLAGVPIERVMFWVPHPGTELGMGISILSYCGSATLAVIADARLVPDPEAITQEFSREFAAMLKAVREKQEAAGKVASRDEPVIRKRAGRKASAATPAKHARPRLRDAVYEARSRLGGDVSAGGVHSPRHSGRVRDDRKSYPSVRSVEQLQHRYFAGH